MATYGALNAAIVHEVLKRDNYKYWRACMESYLKAHDLWETISPGLRDGEIETTEWKKKDSATLHEIQISCGPQFFPEIEDSSSAKDAWEILASWFTQQDSGEEGNILIPSMGTYVAPNTAIVPEFLKTDNYEYCSACKRSYLQAQDLWETIDPGRPHKGWERKNSAALHAIQISCGPQLFPEIKFKSDAKDAWKTLQNKLNPPRRPPLPESESESAPEPEQQPEQPEPRGSDVSEKEMQPLAVPVKTRDQLMRYITNGDWKGLKGMLDIDRSLIKTRIAEDGSTALHNAVNSQQLRVVEGLVGMMDPKDLEIKDKDDRTALICAASIGNTKMAKCMIRKNDKLAEIGQGIQWGSPLSVACFKGHKDTANYLYTKTSIHFLSQENGEHASEVLKNCAYGEMPDIALDLLHRLPDSCKMDAIQNSRVLPILSGKPEAFPSGLELEFPHRWSYWRVSAPKFVLSVGTSQTDTGSGSQTIDLEPGVTTDGNPSKNGEENPSKIGKIYLQGIKQIRDIKHLHVRSVDLLNYICEIIKDLDKQKYKDMGMHHAFTRAATLGIFEIVLALGNIDVDLFDYKEGDDERDVVMLSIIHRQEKVFGALTTFFSGKGDGKLPYSLDKFGNTPLHLAGLLSPPSRLDRFSGATLQMQREVQWYKEVERGTHPKAKEWTNLDGETPSQVFTRCHKDLMAEGQKWMKDAATSCTVVGALIITIMFTAAFTVPGGNQDSGFPNFLHEASFKVFIISDAISLFASASSVMTFLGILTTRYAEQDFYRSLPTQLIIGLSSLFLSIATMMIAFCAALFMILDGNLSYVIPITSLAAAPVARFMFSQFPLLIDVTKSTYGPSLRVALIT